MPPLLVSFVRSIKHIDLRLIESVVLENIPPVKTADDIKSLGCLIEDKTICDAGGISILSFQRLETE